MIAAFAGPLEQHPSGYSDGAALLFEATHSPGAAEHNSGAAARAAAAAAVGGGGEAGMSEFAQEGAWQGSPDSDASLQRVASGASASTSGEGEGLSQGRCRQSLRERARAEAIGVYGERYPCLLCTHMLHQWFLTNIALCSLQLNVLQTCRSVGLPALIMCKIWFCCYWNCMLFGGTAQVMMKLPVLAYILMHVEVVTSSS